MVAAILAGGSDGFVSKTAEFAFPWVPMRVASARSIEVARSTEQARSSNGMSNWIVGFGVHRAPFRAQREPRARGRPIEPTMPSAHRRAE
jgi:hypothetical protein